MGGNIQFANASAAALFVDNGGAIQSNGVFDGRIGFNGGTVPISLTDSFGSGSVQARNFVSFGNLDPLTLLPLGPNITLQPTTSFTFGNVSATQTTPIGSRILVAGLIAPIPSVLPVVMPPQPVAPPLVATAPQIASATLPSVFGVNPIILSTDQQQQLANLAEGESDVLTSSAPLQGYLAAQDPNGWLVGPRITDSYSLLQRGNLFVTAEQDVVIQTPFGEIHAKAGSVLFVMLTDSAVSVHNLHDNNSGDVFFSSGGKRLPIPVGVQLLATESDGAFESLNPAHGIGIRSVGKTEFPNGVKAFAGEFSMISAMRIIEPLRKLRDSDSQSDRDVANRIMRNAAIMMVLTSKNGAYKESSPTQ